MLISACAQKLPAGRTAGEAREKRSKVEHVRGQIAPDTRAMASSRELESFAIPLCLWQRAAFLSPSPFSPVTSTSSIVKGNEGGREERDSLRLRLAQLRHEHSRE